MWCHRYSRDIDHVECGIEPQVLNAKQAATARGVTIYDVHMRRRTRGKGGGAPTRVTPQEATRTLVRKDKGGVGPRIVNPA